MRRTSHGGVASLPGFPICYHLSRGSCNASSDSQSSERAGLLLAYRPSAWLLRPPCCQDGPACYVPCCLTSLASLVVGSLARGPCQTTWLLQLMHPPCQAGKANLALAGVTVVTPRFQKRWRVESVGDLREGGFPGAGCAN